MSAYRDLDLALTEWVPPTQFNCCSLTRRFDSIIALYDGLLLKEFLTLVSLEHFGKVEVVTEIAGEWTNRLKNLQKVKAAMDKFCEGVEGRVPKAEVDLVAIAISQDIHQLCNLLEHVLFCVLNSPCKDQMISRILRLSQSSQVALMHFIKQVTQEDDATGFVMTPTREIKQLRKAQAKLSSHLENVQNEYESVWKEKERIEQEYTEMKLTNTDLESKLVSTVEKQNLTPDTIILDLERKLVEKEQAIQRLKEELAELRKTHEISVNNYRDELDLANSKLDSHSKLEQSAQVMKLTVEELKPLKEQLRLSMEEKETLQRKVDQFEEEESTFQSTSKQLVQVKEALAAEKANKHQLETELLQKESNIKTLMKDNLELVEKLQFLESKNRDLALRLDQFLTESNAEDSFAVGTPIRELGDNSVFRYDNPATLTDEDPKVVRALDFWASDKSMKGMKEVVTLANENRELRLEKETLSEELANLRKMRDIEKVATEAEMNSIRESFRKELHSLQESISESETTTRISIRDYTEQITYLTASVKASEMINSSLSDEIALLKAERATLWEENAQIYKEKDEMSARFVSSRDETLRLNTELAEKTVKISQLEHEISLLKSHPAERPPNIEAQHGLEFVENGRKISELRLRISELESELKQKEIIAQQTESQIKQLQDRYHHSKQKNIHRKSKINRLSRTKEELESMVKEERETFQTITTEMVKTMGELQDLVEVKTLMS